MSILCATFAQRMYHKLSGWKNWLGQVRSRGYDVITGTASDRLFKEIAFSAMEDWLERRHYAWFRSEHDHIWPFTLHPDLSEVIRGHWPWLAPCVPIVANLAVLGFLEVLRPNTGYFFHIAYSASLHYPMSIRVIDPAALRRFGRSGLRCFLAGCYASQISRQ